MELHFGFYQQAGKHKLETLHAICKACHTKIKYVGNTTNFRNHVSRFHPELLAKQQHLLWKMQTLGQQLRGLMKLCFPYC